MIRAISSILDYWLHLVAWTGTQITKPAPPPYTSAWKTESRDKKKAGKIHWKIEEKEGQPKYPTIQYQIALLETKMR